MCVCAFVYNSNPSYIYSPEEYRSPSKRVPMVVEEQDDDWEEPEQPASPGSVSGQQPSTESAVTNGTTQHMPMAPAIPACLSIFQPSQARAVDNLGALSLT
jgi:hypothetical protein